MFKQFLPIFCGIFFLATAVQAQDAQVRKALDYIQAHATEWGLTPADVQDLGVTDHYKDEDHGVTHIYMLQRYQGIAIYNAMVQVHLNSKVQVVAASHRLISNIASKVNTTTPRLLPTEAIQSVAQHFGIYGLKDIRLKEMQSATSGTFTLEQLSRQDIPVQLRYHLMPDGRLRLSWDLSVDLVGTPDYWSIRVDAVNSEILNKHNWTVSCQLGPVHKHDNSDHTCVPQTITNTQHTSAEQIATGVTAPNGNLVPTYRVVKFPNEGPHQGPLQLVSDPADPNWSPFGWHDTNGAAGNEYTTTRGNNGHIFLDRDGDYSANTVDALPAYVNGGASLTFDAPFDDNKEPFHNTQPAIINLFYVVNWIHDWTSKFGFTPVAGAFQRNNYGKPGIGNDEVNAYCQFGGKDTINFLNNANFGTPPDGGSGTMRMYVWDRSNQAGLRYLTVNSPQFIAGQYISPLASFGPKAFAPITGEGIIVDDGTGNSLGCKVPTNAVSGKIAIIDRGTCYFADKVWNAQSKGALAVIIVNFENNVLAQGLPPNWAKTITIPSIMISNVDGQLIKAQLNNGLNMTIAVPNEAITGPSMKDGDMDNGIITHEYGHGISNRLTGGPSAAGCLGNAEQMGEGWSDYYALAATHNGDLSAAARTKGIGTYETREDYVTGKGIRRNKYSTDFLINDYTYDDIIEQTEVHDLGEVWATMLWDMYWLLVDKYGYNGDWNVGTSGNFRAMKLVTEGMKYQNCSPGFVDGRNGILTADSIIYGGEHTCLIWDAFSKRGLGVSAKQGDSNNARDGKESFDDFKPCSKKLLVEKTSDSLEVAPGNTRTITITITNYKGTAVSNVVVTETLPEFGIYVPGSASGGGVQSGNTITWNIANIAPGKSEKRTYKYQAPSEPKSKLYFYDDMEEGDNNDHWSSEVIKSNTGTPSQWEPLTGVYPAHSGVWAYAVPDADTVTDLVLISTQKFNMVTGKPLLRFWQFCDSEPRADAGFIEYSENGNSWTRIDPAQVVLNPYRGPIQYGTFSIPNLKGWWGDNGKVWTETRVDMTPLLGKNVYIRYRWGTDGNNTGFTGTIGWMLDDVQILNAWYFQSNTCVTDAEGDNECVELPYYGVLATPSLTTATQDPIIDQALKVYPNPARQSIHVSLNDTQDQSWNISIIDLQGKVIESQQVQVQSGGGKTQFPVSGFASGMYIIRAQNGTQILYQKVIVEK